VRDSPAAVSIPVTVGFPVAASSPLTGAANVRGLGEVNALNFAGNAIGDGGTELHGGIDPCGVQHLKAGRVGRVVEVAAADRSSRAAK